MELQTIGQVSKQFNVSARTLRYYEQVGLIVPAKNNDNSYRIYDNDAIIRLQQIIILRKLRIPLKQIAEILKSNDAKVAIEAFRHNLSEIDGEITALSTIRGVIASFIERLNLKNEKLALLEDENLLEIVDSLTVTKINFKEEKAMSELSQAIEKMTKLTDHDVRIINLPPMTIAAFRATGENCEGKAGDTIDQFVRESELLEIKPDARSFGFDCSEQFQGIGEPSQSYEVWVSVPDDMDIPAPLRKFHFCGGLFAAHVLKNWDFEMWRHLMEWVNTSNKFDNNAGKQPAFEERLNFFNIIKNGSELQLDLLFPIKLKEQSRH